MIGSRGFDFLSCRAYGNSGTTAVTRFAEPSLRGVGHDQELHQEVVHRHAVAGANDCTMKTSAPRMDSS